MPVPQGSAGDRLLDVARLPRALDQLGARAARGRRRCPSAPLPEGYAVRAAAGREHEACWTVQEDAFLEWSVRERESFEEWRGRA